MTNEQINTAIAAACGWTEIDTTAPERGSLYPHRLIGREPSGKKYFVPNYCADLNATHEAEKVLTPLEWVRYWEFLEPLACRPNNTSILHATAAQRAEAFLRVKGKWGEEAR